MESNLEIIRVPINNVPVSTQKPFIEANTVEGDLSEIRKHLIPVYFDNKPVISHQDFIDSTYPFGEPHV
jgi:hypothetical protein